MYPRRYLLISSLFGSPNPGGGATLSAEVAEEWLKRGHEVHVLSARFEPSNLGELQRYSQTGQLKIHGVFDSKEIEFGHRLDPSLERRVRETIMEIRPDYIHVHNFHRLLSGVNAAVESGYPTIFTALDFGIECITWYLYDGTLIPCSGPEKSKCRDCAIRGTRLRLIDGPYHAFGLLKRAIFGAGGIGHRSYFTPESQRYWRNEAPGNIGFSTALLKKFTAVVAPSPAVHDRVHHYRKSEDGIFQILYPISKSKLSNRSAPTEPSKNAGPLRLAFLGHSHPIKGWPFFLDVLESLPDGLGIEITDAGGNLALFRSASNRVKRYLKKSYRCPPGELSALFANSDAILVPSLWHENTPLVVLETLANRRPVIASDQTGISHVVKQRENGILLPAGERDAWIQELTRLAKDPAMIRDLRSRCHFDRTPADFVDDLEKIESCIPK